MICLPFVTILLVSNDGQENRYGSFTGPDGSVYGIPTNAEVTSISGAAFWTKSFDPINNSLTPIGKDLGVGRGRCLSILVPTNVVIGATFTLSYHRLVFGLCVGR